jgi:tRNA C32,U32 (ribose-2'-O)-methylase TrmJ
MAQLAGENNDTGEQIADDYVDAQKMESFFEHYFHVMEKALYLRKQGHESLKTKIRIMYNRIRPKKHEIDILRGFLSKLEKKLK